MADKPTAQADRFVYLVQHGEAKPKDEDPDRSLTDQGKQIVMRMAAWAAQVGLRVDQVRHSGKLRAEQTAAAFAEKLQPRDGIASYPGMGPNDDVEPIAGELADCPCSVMLVGHLPFLSRLASHMLAGDSEKPLIQFRNAGIVGLVRQEHGWAIACLIPPEAAGHLPPTGMPKLPL